jgi:hypothetical protein
MRPLLLALVAALLLPACQPEPEPEPPPFEPIPWTRGQPELDVSVRGLREVRAIVHAHSHWSHDACDSEPQPGGVPDEQCLTELREGLCITRMDVAMMSDHPSPAEEVTLQERLLNRGDDELVYNEAGDAIATWFECEGTDHRVLVLPGLEDDLMPLGMEADVIDASESLTAESVQALQDEANAVVFVNHTEQYDAAEIEPLGIDGIELYQLHANLAPDIREEDLGLERFGYIGDVAPFLFPELHDIDDPPHPDLALAGFIVPIEPSFVVLETLGQTQHIAGAGATDAHRNTFPTLASDDERFDSYRRMFRWFNNRLRIDGELDPWTAKEALRASRAHTVFEVFGTPVGFDFRAESGGDVHEAGAEVPLGADPVRIHVDLPTLDERSPRGVSAPEITGRLYRATPEGRELLSEWSDGALELAADTAGVYRVEVWITPLHLEPYFGEVYADYVTDEVPWIQTGAIFIR